MKRLSVLIVINNEEKQIEECLKSVKFADEIVVILDRCTDNSEKIVKKVFKKEIITPGIRLLGDLIGDQKRIMTPKEAFQNGATSRGPKNDVMVA